MRLDCACRCREYNLKQQDLTYLQLWCYKMLLIVDVMSSLHTHMDMNKSGMMPSVESMTEPQLSMDSLSRNDEQQSMLFNQTQEGVISQELQARVDKLEKGLINANQLLQPTTANTSNRSSTSHKELPTCELLMKRPDSPVADGTFLSRSTTPNTGTLRADGSRELGLPFTWRLKRYTSSEAQQCLSNWHMSFIGDSIS